MTYDTYLHHDAMGTEEYPVCATEKNIVLPYPTIDPDFYAGKAAYDICILHTNTQTRTIYSHILWVF
jgi:hypothetical protein